MDGIFQKQPSKSTAMIFNIIKSNFWPTSAFVALFITWHLCEFFNFDLDWLNDFQVGIAGKYGVDVMARVHLFYFAVASALSVFLLSQFLFSKIYQNQSDLPVLRVFNGLAAFGIANLILTVHGNNQMIFIENLFWVLLILISGSLIVNKTRFKNDDQIVLNLLLTFSFYLLFVFVFQKMHVSLLSGYTLLAFCFVTLWFLPTSVLFKLKYLLLIPVLLFVANEAYMILNQREISFLSPSWLFLILISGFALSIFFVKKQNQNFSYSTGLIYLSLFGIGLCIAYHPFIKAGSELFETANPANSLWRTYGLGEMPLIDYLNSHLFSETWYAHLYVLLNGWDNTLSFATYFYLYYPIYLILAFYVLQKLFDNKLFSIAFILLFPYLHDVFPEYYWMVVLTLIVALKYFENPVAPYLRNYLLILLLLFFWRLDIAIGLLLVMLLLLARTLYLSKPSRKVLFKAFLPVLLLTIFFLIIAFTQSNLNEISTNLKQALGYFGAAQSHGLPNVTEVYDQMYYFFHFWNPLITLIVLVWSGIRFFQNDNLQNKWFYLTLFFLSAFYFMNVQRGLVRHNYLSGNDRHIAAFVVLILSLAFTTYFKSKKFSTVNLFSVSALLLSNFFHLPNPDYRKNAMVSFIEKNQNQVVLHKQNRKVHRVTDQSEAENKYWGEMKIMMDDIMEQDETFLDFSNSPMLYFYTQRRIPSYFNQYLQNTVTRSLQLANLKQLENEKIKLVCFSKQIPDFWDQTDGIPNNFRYREITLWIYEHFEPWGVCNKHVFWKRKNEVLTHELVDENQVTLPIAKMELGLLPSYINIKINTGYSIQILNQVKETITCKLTETERLKACILNIETFASLDHTEPVIIRIKDENGIITLGEIAFKTRLGRVVHTIPLDILYPFYINQQLIIEIKKPEKLKILNLQTNYHE
jgi:hypothetical protein